jgi:small nuclear ribonucleoprotein (snRNP)-like protein
LGGLATAVVLSVLAFRALPACAEPQGGNELETRVRKLHAESSRVKVKLADGTVLQGRIVGVEPDSFAIRDEKTGRQTAVAYAQVKELKKSGLSRRTKAILIPAIVGGGVLLVLCAGPYPIGFLCRKDPS